MDPRKFSFHAFQCSGPTYNFNQNMTFEDIHIHGSWKSDYIYRYLQIFSAADKVAKSYQ